MELEQSRDQGADLPYSHGQPSFPPSNDVRRPQLLDEQQDFKAGEPAAWPIKEKHEFNLDRPKFISSVYKKLHSLVSFSAVEPKCREMIAKHQLFELYHLHKADDVEFTEQRGLMSFNCWIHCTGVGSTHPPGEEDTTKDSDLQGCTYHW